MKILLLILACGLTACTTVKVSSPRTVVVVAGDIAYAMPEAQKECARYGRHPRFSGFGINRLEFIFDCVE